MADTSNLTNFLGDIADAIRTKKSTTEQIPAENFDQEILSIETGIDTSDATATAEEVRMGKTAYVKGEKITGTLEYAINSSNPITNGRENVTDTGDNIQVLRGYGKTLLLGADQNFETKIPYADVATMGNITADKIVKGNTIFGIEGVAETGGSGDIKLFETEEEMQADTNAKEGDLAVVYREEIQNATVNSQFQLATFPETVVLDTAITDDVEVRYRAVDDSVMFDCRGQLDSSNFMMDCWSESGSVRIQYESSDGVTYTRTRMQGDSGNLENPVDFGTEIYYEMTEMWNDAIGKFIQIGGSTFEGLYKYVLNVPINSFKLREQRSANYNLTYTQNNPGLDKIYTGEEVFTGEDVGNKIREILKNEIRGAMFLSKDMSILYLVPTQFQNLYVYNNKLEPLVFNSADKVADIVYYKYTLSDMQREEITMTKSELGILDDGGVVTNLPDDSYYMLGIVNSTGTYIRWTVSSVSYYQIYTVGTGTEIEYDDRYIIADTQLTLNNANQLLPGKIAYGKNGIVEGDESIYEQIPKSINIKNVLGYIPDKDNMECIGTIDGEYGKGTLLASTKLDELDNISNRLQLRYVTNTILDNVKTKINEYMGTTNYSYTFEGSTDTYLYFYYRDGGSNTGKVIYYMCRYNKITNQFDGKNVFTAATFTVAQYQYYMSSYFYKVPNTHNCYDFIYPNNEEKTYCVNINFDNMTAKTVYAWSSRDTQVCEGGCCTIGDYLYGFYYQYSNKVFRIKLSTNTMTLNVYSNSASGYPMYYRPQVAIKNGIPYIVFWFASQMVLFKLSSDGSSITSTKTIFTTSSTKYANNMTQFDYGDDTYFLTSDTYNFGSEFQGFKLALNGSTELLTGWNISSLPSTYEQHNTNVYFKQINDIIYCASINSATLYKIDVLNKTTTVSKYHTNTITSNYTYIYNCYNTKLKEIDDMKRIYTVEQYDGETVHEVTLLCYLGYGYTLFNNVKELYSIITKLNDKCKIVYKSSLENLLPDYTDTITPTEYNTAIDTANEILGEEV